MSQQQKIPGVEEATGENKNKNDEEVARLKVAINVMNNKNNSIHGQRTTMRDAQIVHTPEAT